MLARELIRALAIGMCGTVLGVAGTLAWTSERSTDHYPEIYRRLHPSVVLLTMKVRSNDPHRKGAWEDGFGSGVVIESGSWGSRILTDAHVVDDERDLRATVGDVGPAVPARVVARTAEDASDLALVEISTPNLPVTRLADPGTIEPGRPIGLLGYPIPDAFSDEKLRRTVSLYDGRVASVRNGTLEIDLPIVPGESGGPVFDAQTGAVLGLAESRFDEERAIGFATPVGEIRAFLAAHRRGK
jgi:S1-C subfamily serine protease